MYQLIKIKKEPYSNGKHIVQTFLVLPELQVIGKVTWAFSSLGMVNRHLFLLDSAGSFSMINSLVQQ